MPNVSFAAPTDAQAEAEQIARQRKYAELLQEQSMQPLNGQMAGRFYVAPSWTQHAAKLTQGLTGALEERQADEKQKALAQKLREQGLSDVQNFTQALQGQQAKPFDIPANEMDSEATTGMQKAIAPDRQKALAIALQSQNPMVAGAGSSMLAEMLKPKTPIKVGKDDSLIDPVTMQPMYQGKPQPKFHVVGGNLVQEPQAPGQSVAPVFTAPKDVKDEAQKLTDILVAGGIDPTSPQGQNMFRAMATKMATHQPSASNNVTIKQEGAEAGAVGKAFGEEFNTLQKMGADAGGKINRLDRISSLLQGVSTGKLTPAATEVAALADSIGIKIDKNLGAKQAAEALGNEIALQMRNPSGGAGMPGALSDKDREFLKAMTPGLAKTPEGNAMIIDTAKKLAKRDQEVAKLARDYRRANGSMNEGFYDALQKYSDSNPLFGPASTAPSGPASPSGWGIKRVN